MLKFKINCFRSEKKRSQPQTQNQADAHRTSIDTDDIGLCTRNISQGK